MCLVTFWSTDNVTEHEVPSQAQEEYKQIKADGPVTEGGKIREIKMIIRGIFKIVSKWTDLLTWIPLPVQLENLQSGFQCQ